MSQSLLRPITLEKQDNQPLAVQEKHSGLPNEQLRGKIERAVQNVIGRNATCQKDPAAKPILLKEEYWLEAIDPAHRYGGYIYPMFLLWKNWDAQVPFFEWLEETGKQLIINKNEKALGFLHQYWESSIYTSIEGFDSWLKNLVNPSAVIYLDETVQNYLITFDETGRLLQDRQPLDTKGQRYIFVLDPSLNLYGCNYYPAKWHHTTLTKGGAILAGGGLDAQAGRILSIDDKCGHYDDGNQVDQAEKSMKYFLKFLLKNGVDLSQTELKINARPHSKYQAFCLKALEFLEDNYADQTWYIGAISREAALQKFKVDGTTPFLVRQSENPVPLSQRKTVNGHATVTAQAPCFEIVYQKGENEFDFIPIHKDGLGPFSLLDLHSQHLTDLIVKWAEAKGLHYTNILQTAIDKLDIDDESKQPLYGLLSQFQRRGQPQRGLDQFIIERVPHGHSHKNFYLQMNGEPYFLKLAHPSKTSYIAWEYNVLQQLGKKCVKFNVPTPVDFVQNGHGILLLKQIPGVNWQFSDHDFLDRVIPEIQKVHSTVLPVEKELDHIDLVIAAVERTKSMREDQLIQSSDILRIRDALQPYLAKLKKVFCHNDLHSGNLFSATDGSLYIIDWETAAYNYYIFDLAIIASHHQLSIDQMKAMLVRYNGSSGKEFEMLLLARTIVDLYYHLWCIERLAISDRKESLRDFAKIYLESYERHLGLSRSLGLI